MTIQTWEFGIYMDHVNMTLRTLPIRSSWVWIGIYNVFLLKNKNDKKNCQIARHLMKFLSNYLNIYRGLFVHVKNIKLELEIRKFYMKLPKRFWIFFKMMQVYFKLICVLDFTKLIILFFFFKIVMIFSR